MVPRSRTEDKSLVAIHVSQLSDLGILYVCLFGLQITEIITDAIFANLNGRFDIKCS